MQGDLLPVWGALVVQGLSFGMALVLALALTSAAWRNHLRAKVRPAVVSGAALMWALAALFFRGVGMRYATLAAWPVVHDLLSDGIVGDLVILAVLACMVGWFFALIVAYPELRPRDPEKRTRSEDKPPWGPR